jgi:hypothetical protein
MKAFAPCTMISLALMFFLFPLDPGETHEGHSIKEKRIFTKHFQETLFDVTGKAAYSVEVLLDDKEYAIGKQVIGIVVHDEHDDDVKGAELTIVHKNLTTSETAPGTLTVTDKGNGLYIVSGLDLQRAGRWELAITVKKNSVEDSVKFVLPDALKERVPKGRYSP